MEANGSVHFQGQGATTVSGVIVGDKITLTVEFDKAESMLSFEGRIDGDSMSGGYTEGDKSGQFKVSMRAGGQANFQK